MFAKHDAWLTCIPEKKQRKKEESRKEIFSRQGNSFAELPPIEAGGYLLDILLSVGPAKSSGMGGVEPISEVDLLAWQWNQKTRLHPWECRVIRQLSKEYASMLNAGADPKVGPPYVGVTKEVVTQRKIVDSAFRRLAAQRKGTSSVRGKRRR